MPRGVPKAGFRAPRGSRKGFAVPQARQSYGQMFAEPVITETFEQIDARIAERFEILDILTNAAVTGDARAVIVSGPAGLGKSFNVEKVLKEWDPVEENHQIIKGFVRATGLYRALYKAREKGQVIVFDDADSIFFDDICLNMLKAVCDSNDVRRVSWLAETRMIDEEEASVLPRSFEFEGTIIFITNYDFDAMIDKGHKLAPHLQAMVSRAHYIDLAMKTKRDYLVRIQQVVRKGMLDSIGPTARQEVLEYIESNSDRLRELSLRMVLKVATVRKTGGANWRRVANVTCCK